MAETCCCCIPLRIGCLIIGYLQTIGVFPLLICSLVLISLGFHNANAFDQELSSYFFVVGGMVGIVSLLYLSLCICLLIGLHQNKPKLVKPYIIFYTVLVVLLVLPLFCIYFMPFERKAKAFVSLMINTGPNIYFLVEFYRYYNIMKEEKRQGNAMQMQDIQRLQIITV